MAVRCSKCGEQLLGSVNRCWQCGQSFAGEATSSEIPPIRVPPVVSDTAVDGPDAAPSSAPAADAAAQRGRIVKPDYPGNVFRENCAISSVVVGVMMCLGSFLTFWVAIPATIGVLLGVNGLWSRRRITAAVGISLCSLAFVSVTTRALIGLYRVHQQQQQEIWDEF